MSYHRSGPSTTAPSPSALSSAGDVVHLLDLLVAGHSVRSAARLLQMSVPQVRSAAYAHGYPDICRMAWGIDVLRKPAPQVEERRDGALHENIRDTRRRKRLAKLRRFQDAAHFATSSAAGDYCAAEALPVTTHRISA